MFFITENCEFQLFMYDTAGSPETVRPTHNRDICSHFTIFLNETNNKEVTQTIDNLKLESATGFNNIFAKEILMIRDNIVQILVKLLNNIFQPGIFLQYLKNGKSHSCLQIRVH